MPILHIAPRETASDWSCYFLPIALFVWAVAAFFLDSFDSDSILVIAEVQRMSRPGQARTKGQARVQISSIGDRVLADNYKRFVAEVEAIEV